MRVICCNTACWKKRNTNQQAKHKLLDHLLLKAEVFRGFIPIDKNFVRSSLKLNSLSGDRSKGFKEPTNN